MSNLKKTDHQIKEDVTHELEWDVCVDETAIGVAVNHGIVTLTGTVGSWGEKHAAQEAAHRVIGVLDVANDIEIRMSWDTQRNDTDLAAAVRSALQWNVFVPDERIKSTVDKGIVTLTGEVETIRERDNAARAIRALPGIRGVENRIVITVPHVSERAVHEAIEAALARHTAREASRVTVEVLGDVVVLGGAVGSWAERKAVVGAAKGTRGVREVSDHIRLG